MESFKQSRELRRVLNHLESYKRATLCLYTFFSSVWKYLGHIINSEVESGNQKPVKTTREGPSISHLFSVNDLMLFEEASWSQNTVIEWILAKFCDTSGQMVNISKSKLYVSPNIDLSFGEQLSDGFGIYITKELGVYLGMPLIHG